MRDGVVYHCGQALGMWASWGHTLLFAESSLGRIGVFGLLAVRLRVEALIQVLEGIACLCAMFCWRVVCDTTSGTAPSGSARPRHNGRPNHSVSSWWRQAGRLARPHGRPEGRWCVTAMWWRSVWWRTALKGVLRRGTANTARQRLNRAQPDLGTRQWDDPLQRQVDAAAGKETPWREFAQDRGRWQSQEASLFARSCHTEKRELPRTRWLMHTAG